MDITREIFPGRMQNKMGNAIRQTDKLQEIRIRVNTPIMLRSDGIEYFVSENGKITRRKEMAEKVQKRDIEDIISHICRSSPYAFEEEIKRGYLTIEGGHRVGITGQAVLDCSGDIKTMKNISFLNIRIAHEVIGVSKEVIKDIFIGGMLQNTLIISPPGFGKTTLLRDLVREVSNGNTYGSGLQCCIIDERSELAGCFRGIPQLDVGCRTDVLDGCPKAVGMMMAVRSMAPQVIAVDELGTMEDIHALFSLIRSGCRILATIHGDGISELKEKSFLREVMKEKVFERYIVIYHKQNMVVFNGELQKC